MSAGGAVTAALRRLCAREDLSRADTEALFGALMDGEVSDPLKAALLAALAVKGEAAAEIAGAATAMRRRVVPIPHGRSDLVDTCGTGGDGAGTFNVSTAAALVAAAGGLAVAKHGNRSVSSRSGSADVLAALGVEIELPPAAAARALDEVGIAFLFAPLYHPAMKAVAPVRRELGVRTIFNVLGPLTNPAGARRQLLGVFAPHLVETAARVLAELGSEHALVVHGSDGLDEITTTGPTMVAEARRRGGPGDAAAEVTVTVYTVEPEELGVARARPGDLAGGTPEDNAAALERVLAGEPGPLAEVTVLNAGAALYAGGAVASLAEGVERARELIASGAAREKLAALRAFSDALRRGRERGAEGG